MCTVHVQCTVHMSDIYQALCIHLQIAMSWKQVLVHIIHYCFARTVEFTRSKYFTRLLPYLIILLLFKAIAQHG